MASPTYHAKGIVLRKNPLGESDLIIEVLDASGGKLKLVAKGARKPSGRFSAHLELFNTCDLLCVKGKNLDIVKESRLLLARPALMSDPSKNAAASTIAELLSSMAQVSLEQPRLFDMTNAAFSSIETSGEDQVALILAADILKTMAVSGLRPVLTTCATCGSSVVEVAEIQIDPEKLDADACDVRFSHLEGGIICKECSHEVETIWVPKASVILAERLLMSRFDEISQMKVSNGVIIALLQTLQSWVGVHIGTRLRSLDFFMKMSFIYS